MKSLRKTLPVILMVWPYLPVVYSMLPGASTVSGPFFAIYFPMTAAVYAMNLWNACTYPYEDAGRTLAFYDMAVKLVHIPFYIGVFIIGIVFLLAMVVPALLLISPIAIFFLAVSDFFLMLTSSLYGINAAVRLSQKKTVTKQEALLHIVLHLFFVLDVISAVCLFRKRKGEAL